MRAPVTTSPATVTLLDRLFVIDTIAWGSIAFGARRCSIVRCTSNGVRPATGTCPANGTVIMPSCPTTCSGINTLRDPGETPSALDPGPNRPPPAASQIETATVSPTPILGCGGLPYFLKRAE